MKTVFLIFFLLPVIATGQKSFFSLIQKTNCEVDASQKKIEVIPIAGITLAGESADGNTIWVYPVKKIIYFYSYFYRRGFFSVELVGGRCPYEFSLEEGGGFIIPHHLGRCIAWSSTRQINPQTVRVKIQKE